MSTGAARAARAKPGFSDSEVRAYYAARVPELKQAGAEWRGICPVHRGERDSFAVNPETGDAFCHSQCGRGWDILALEQLLSDTDFMTAKADVFRIVGRVESSNGNHGRPRPARIERTYDYTDERGRLLYQTVRMDPKGFRQRRPDGNDGWLWNIKGVRLVLYRLPELLKRGAETIYICEGERDVETLD